MLFVQTGGRTHETKTSASPVVYSSKVDGDGFDSRQTDRKADGSRYSVRQMALVLIALVVLICYHHDPLDCVVKVEYKSQDINHSHPWDVSKAFCLQGFSIA